MTRVLIPTDTEAEQSVAGSAAASLTGAHLAAARVRVEDFYDPRCGRVVTVATCGAIRATEDGATAGDRLDARLAGVALAADLPLSWVRRIADERATMRDVTGCFARRVATAAFRRRLMAAAAELYELASTADMNSVRLQVATILAAIEASEQDIEVHNVAA